MCHRSLAILTWLAGITLFAAACMAAVGTLHFQIFVRTHLRLTDIVWTGRQFLYVENTTNRVFASGPSGRHLTALSKMPRQVEETRCVVPTGSHGFPSGYLYCHAPDNKIYRLSANGKKVSVFATVPHVRRSDGALAFDTVGRFGDRFIAATGRSGNGTARGGSVFTSTPGGFVQFVAHYSNPGGADEAAVAPAHFGSASGDILLTVDAGRTGSVVVVSPGGRVRTIAALPDGPNPIVTLDRDRSVVRRRRSRACT